MATLRNIAGKMKSALAPTPTRPFFALLAVYAVLQAAFLATVAWKHGFRVRDPLVVLYFAEKAVFDFALYFAVAAALLRLTRRAWPAFLFSVVYFGVLAADTLVYYFSSTLLELQHFDLIEGYSLEGFVTPISVGFATAFALALAALYLSLKRLAPRASWPSAARFALLAVALGAARIPTRASEVTKEDERYDKVIMVFRNAQLEYASQNPLLGFGNDIVLRGISEELYTMKGSATYREYMKDYDFIAQDYSIANSFAPYRRRSGRGETPPWVER